MPGNFRPDLYYRLNVFPINVPALRERKEDLPLLVDFFLERYRPDLKGRLTLHPEAMAEFMNYPWPGNIRELKNVIERANHHCKRRHHNHRPPAPGVRRDRRTGRLPGSPAGRPGQIENGHGGRGNGQNPGQKISSGRTFGACPFELFQAVEGPGAELAPEQNPITRPCALRSLLPWRIPPRRRTGCR